MTGAHVAREPDRAGHIDAARSAEAQPFLAQQIEDDRQRLGVGDLVGLVDHRTFEIGGDAALADAFGDRASFRLELAVLVVIVERRAHRIGEADGDVLVLRLQPHGDAGERAAGADGADEAVDLALRVVPDLGRRRLDMALAVGDIVELVGPDRAMRRGRGKLLGEPAGIFHVVVRVLVRNRGDLDQLGAGKPQHLLLLVGLRVGDDDDGLQPERIADERKPMPVLPAVPSTTVPPG